VIAKKVSIDEWWKHSKECSSCFHLKLDSLLEHRGEAKYAWNCA